MTIEPESNRKGNLRKVETIWKKIRKHLNAWFHKENEGMVSDLG